MSRVLRRGGRLGKYRLEQRLGEGGSAVVWRARDTIEGRRVALKIVLPSVIAEFGRHAVEAEARTAAQLDHPRVATIRNADWIDSHFVIVTELAANSLDRYTGARRSPAVALSILCDIAEGLAYAHSRGLIHRDIKPANIFLYEGRRARLGDFGTARLARHTTHRLTEAGTFGYMAPEQAYGRPRFASDVFSLALTGYELFAGVLPTWPFEWPLAGHRRFESRCPEAVQRVLRRGLEVDVRKRWSDGIEFHRALTRAVERGRVRKPTVRSTTGPKKARSRSANQTPEPFSLEAQWFRKRFGKLFETHFDCHACEGPISESMSHCPWCGTDRNSFIEVTSFPLVCPECERGVRPEWSACPTCSRGRFEANGRAIPTERAADATATRVCRRENCRAPLHRFMRYCPACKTKVARPWKLPDHDTCAGCGWAIGARWRFCGWCGRKNARALQVGLSKRKV